MKRFIRNISVIVIVGAVSTICTSCSQPASIGKDLQTAEMAVAAGDMEVATSVAHHLFEEDNLSGMTATQLARLSIVYMQLADSTDNSNNVASATQIYRRAYELDADSAEIYYSSLPTEKAQYSMMLSAIAGSQETIFPVEEEADNDNDHFSHDSL